MQAASKTYVALKSNRFEGDFCILDSISFITSVLGNVSDIFSCQKVCHLYDDDNPVQLRVEK